MIFDTIPPMYMDKVYDKVNFIKCKKRQQFMMEGAPVNGLFFIVSGKAKVLKTGIFGKEQILRFVGEGEMIGYRGFATHDTYGIGAVALEDSLLCHFSNSLLEELFQQVPKLTYAFMLFYAQELNRSENKVKALAQMTVREKVIDAFLYLHRKFGINPKGFLKLKLSRREIADFAGTTDEQVIRVISSLKKEGKLGTLGKQISIIDIAELKKEISEHNYFLDS
ncbi:Crp/Fnr family transcriptional regulator [Urechidicola sp. KH5]